ncbi:hypothetical protein TYRP_003330 [Tyrophagus putrescentiae]|nr:hypothetical protein TYRP_003330 [Tyrophagus putrescentiae]
MSEDDKDSLDFSMGSKAFAVPDADLIQLILGEDGAAAGGGAGGAGEKKKEKKKSNEGGVGGATAAGSKQKKSPEGTADINKKQKVAHATGTDSTVTTPSISGSNLSDAPSTTLSGINSANPSYQGTGSTAVPPRHTNMHSAGGASAGGSPRGASPLVSPNKPANPYDNPYCVPKKGVGAGSGTAITGGGGGGSASGSGIASGAAGSASASTTSAPASVASASASASSNVATSKVSSVGGGSAVASDFGGSGVASVFSGASGSTAGLSTAGTSALSQSNAGSSALGSGVGGPSVASSSSAASGVRSARSASKESVGSKQKARQLKHCKKSKASVVPTKKNSLSKGLEDGSASKFSTPEPAKFLADALEGALHRSGQARSCVFGFEQVEPVDGRSAGRGAGVTQTGGRRLQRLRGHLHGDHLRHAHLEAAVGEGADEVVHEGKTIAAQGADSVHGRLWEVLQLGHRGEHVAHHGGALLAVRLNVEGAQAEAVGDGGIEHHSVRLQLVLVRVVGVEQRLLQVGQRNAAHQREQVQRVALVGNVVGGEGHRTGAAQLEQLADDVAVHGDEDHVAVQLRKEVVVALRHHAAVLLEAVQRSARLARHVDATGGDLGVPHQALHNRLHQLAGAQKADAGVLQGGAGASLATTASRLDARLGGATADDLVAEAAGGSSLAAPELAPAAPSSAPAPPALGCLSPGVAPVPLAGAAPTGASSAVPPPAGPEEAGAPSAPEEGAASAPASEGGFDPSSDMAAR